MNRSLAAAAVALAGLVGAPASRAGDLPALLDGTANSRLFDTHFGRYGYRPERSVVREAGFTRFWLPAQAKGVSQTGLYSYFAVAGDFEISASYEVLALPPPPGGYGVSLGLVADTDSPDGSVSLARGHLPTRGSGYVVTRGVRAGDKMDYKVNFVPTQSKWGRLILRRRKAEVVCLVADGAEDPPREIRQVPFTQRSVRKLRLYADPGGSPTAVDGRLGNLVVQAEEITGGIPQKERSRPLGWWLAGAGVLAVGALTVFAFRRWRRGSRAGTDASAPS